MESSSGFGWTVPPLGAFLRDLANKEVFSLEVGILTYGDRGSNNDEYVAWIRIDNFITGNVKGMLITWAGTVERFWIQPQNKKNWTQMNADKRG